MAYRLNELKVQIKGVAGDHESKPVPPLSPRAQARLTRRLDINEGFLREPGAESVRTQIALAQEAAIALRRAENEKYVGAVSCSELTADGAEALTQ